MNLSKFSDYSFRALIYLAENQSKLCTVEEVANYLNISEHHLKKIVQRLGKTEYIISSKGRNGGLKLGLDPQNINLGEVLKVTEENLTLVECFSEDKCTCHLNGICKLKAVFDNSLNSFINELSKYTLEDII